MGNNVVSKEQKTNTYERLINKVEPEYKGSTMFNQAINPVVKDMGIKLLDYSNGVYLETKGE